MAILNASGLRTKALAALALACVVVLILALLVGNRVLDGARTQFSESFAENFTQLSRQRILAPVSRDLALSQRLAESSVARAMLLDEQDEKARQAFFREARDYQEAFLGNNYFLISALSNNYYLNDPDRPDSEAPRYMLDEDSAEDSWFFDTLAETDAYNINVNIDQTLDVTRVWLNVVVYDDEGRKIGLAGTGIDVTDFLDRFIQLDEPGVTPMILSASGAIQAHPDPDRIAWSSGVGEQALGLRLQDDLNDDAERNEINQLLARSEAQPDRIHQAWVEMDGKPLLLTVGWIEELRWHVTTLVDPSKARVIDAGWLRIIIFSLVLLLIVLLILFSIMVERVVIRPLQILNDSAQALSRGHFDVELPPEGKDEIGQLTASFSSMARQLKRYTRDLEQRVEERTQELQIANAEMESAHRHISDSIQHASLIQQAMLPGRQMREQFDRDHFVWWRPRDVVGGDFYLFRRAENGFLIGMIDCAGHGVPGALMTMLARAAFEDAMNRHGLESPAALLTQADESLREMMHQSHLPHAVATNMDVGLVWIQDGSSTLRFAGAKSAIYGSDGETVVEIDGDRRALCDRHQSSYHDQEVETKEGMTWYLASDGFLDQAGGDHGYGYGRRRFRKLVTRLASLSADEQLEELNREFTAWSGDLPQRDDVTILAFRTGAV